ncbi:MAG: hypothetical protein DMG81_13670 [Acidobacteria bacterium]|nr:MAG: hypothetical protein DMG81_13670 [Acidobacteriota bacterium]
MLALQYAEAVLQSPSGKDRAVANRALTFQIQFRGPTGSDPVFDLHVRSNVGTLPGTRNSGSRVSFEFQVTRFFEMVVISDEVGALLRAHKYRAQ